MKHVILALEGEKAVLVDTLAREEAMHRSAEQTSREARAKLRDLERALERDTFVASLVKERDEALRDLALMRTKMDARISELESKLARVTAL